MRIPAPPFVFGTGLDTNSTLTPTGSHRAHGRLAFQIVKERCSSRRWTLCPRNQGRTLLRNRNRQVMLWWSRTGSNRRPPACKAGALPIELRPHPDRPSSAPPGLGLAPIPEVVGLDGFEPSTPALSRRCSNQLSYKPGSDLRLSRRTRGPSQQPIGCGHR